MIIPAIMIFLFPRRGERFPATKFVGVLAMPKAATSSPARAEETPKISAKRGVSGLQFPCLTLKKRDAAQYANCSCRSPEFHFPSLPTLSDLAFLSVTALNGQTE